MLFTLASPEQSSSQVKLSPIAILALRATLLVPYMLTWLVAVTGWYYFHMFATDAKRKHLANHYAFRFISRGLGLLIFDLVGVPMISAARTFWAQNLQAAEWLTIISNYFHIIIPLLAFSYLYVGTRKLVLSSHYAASLKNNILPSLIATTIFISFFSIALFGNTSRQMISETGRFASYYVSDTLIVLTIIIPLSITWLLGIQAALNTERYVHSLTLIWRSAFIRFFHGLLAIIGSSIILQGITAFGSEQLQQVNLLLILLVIYMFIIIQAVGYLLIRSSAKQLHKLLLAGVAHEAH